MTLQWVWLRLELRRRWRSLAVLALLIAFTTGTVLAAVAGARRGASAFDRLSTGALPADVVVLPNQPGFDWDRIRALPEVAAVSTFVVGDLAVESTRPDIYANFPPADDEVFRTIEKPVLLAGRMFDPTRVDEVVVSAGYPAAAGQGVGGRVTFRLASPEQGEMSFDPYANGMQGPRIEARVVGVIKTPWFVDPVGAGGFIVASPAVFAKYPDNLLGAGHERYINALVRLHGGAATIPAFKVALARATGKPNIDVWRRSDETSQYNKVLAFEAAALLAFGLAALAAATVLVGQSVARYATSTVTELDVLRAMGLTRRQATGVAAIGPFLAAIPGALIGIGGAVIASAWLPIGTAALFEPAPGIDVDLPILLSGGLAVIILVTAAAGTTAWLALRRNPARPPSRSMVAVATARLGLPVPIVVGARFALERGRGATAVPVRPALLGAVTGVLGVLAALTFSSGVADAAVNPARYGQTFQAFAFFGLNGQSSPATPAVLTAIAADRDVAALTEAKVGVAQAGADISVTMYGYRSPGAPVDQVIVAGRAPRAPDETLLGVSTARRLAVTVGSMVTLEGPRGRKPYRVTGIGFVPIGSHNGYDDGGVLTFDGFDQMFDSYKFHLALIAFAPGADQDAVMARLHAATTAIPGGDTVGVEVQQPPPTLAVIQRVQVLPLVLGGFLALLAIGAVGHALATAVRRRRHEVAVLRALGMTRPQTRTVVIAQATLLALVGLLFGAPLGFALGRVVWRMVADATPLFYHPPLAVWALVLVGPATLLVANLLATWPGHLYTRLRPAHVLRAE
ncbi:hypothetical protein GCM10009555_055390 [Acrocarpospora macrocephala]|uniref:ABC3 transporter permease C-terminal domain-containing protein n=1 Tax=Acrocarpospora macrocephala TaxID=150177 RepID=A0A5M3WVR1_9ACTN|nr:FtsX-like permease family protein [Acrocarpospora macrocephala]GES10643.1 hypothetical protein Amac_042400 [Acrocarpospora macrocephala]